MNAARDASDRTCPRCSTEVTGERLEDGTTRTILWRRKCGWSHLVTESGVVTRPHVQSLIDAERATEDPVED